jgi:glycine/D-amino acid oxidase-like deaminating enzyme
MKIAVIGGGVFGAMTATRLAKFGGTVSLFERMPVLMQGTSSLANRLHCGFHYPRHEETARQCMRGFNRFQETFAAAILPGVFNAYFIASQDSLTSPSNFLEFCQRMNLAYRQIEPDKFLPPVKNVALGVITDEVMYDPTILHRLLTDRLRRSRVEERTGSEVIDIKRDGHGFEIFTQFGRPTYFDAVVNCCYADRNRLTSRLGHPTESPRYEYVAVPVVELDLPQPVSISILDGPFMCLLPFGAVGQYLLYHVDYGVIAREQDQFLDRRWLDPNTSPFAAVNKRKWFDAQLASCCEFVPALRDCRLKGFVQQPRMVLADSEDTDARPSIVTQHEPGYISVFSGKVDHSVWVAEEICNRLSCSRQSQPGVQRPSTKATETMEWTSRS